MQRQQFLKRRWFLDPGHVPAFWEIPLDQVAQGLPIRAEEPPHPHSRYDHFLPYGDARVYKTGVGKVRNNFVDIKRAPPAGAKHEPKER